MILIKKYFHTQKYRPDIDGLRALAVLSVITFHAFPEWIRGGFIGVDVFFVISGFLISTIILSDLEKGTFSFCDFYIRRINRIFPALIVVLVFCWFFGWFALLADEYKQLGKHMAVGSVFMSNLVLWSEAGYFDGSAETKPLLHLWSLAIEEQFYIVWPLFLWFVWKNSLNILTITVLVSIVSFFLNIKGVSEDSVSAFYSPQTRFWELLTGSLLAGFNIFKKDVIANIKANVDAYMALVFKKTTGKAVSNALSFFGLLLLVYGFLQFNKELNYPGKWALVPVVGTVLLLAADPEAFFNRTILSNKVAVWFGVISFPLYLWHWPLLSFARIIESEEPSALIIIVALVLAVVLAWLTYKYVERPVRTGTYSKTKATIAIAFMFIVGCAGYYTFSRDGLSFRKADGLTKLIADTQSSPNNEIKEFYWDEKDSGKFRMDNRCRDIIGNAIANTNGSISCRFSSDSPAQLIVGDSHALSFAYEYLVNNKGDVAMISASGCLPFEQFVGIGIHEKFLSKSLICSSLLIGAVKLAAKLDSIKNVIFVTRGPLYINGNGFGEVEKNMNFRISLTEDDSNPDNYRKFVAGYVSAAKKFIALNKKITFVIDNPELGVDPSSCIDNRPLRLLRKQLSSCMVSKVVVLERQEAYRKSLKEISSSLNVGFFDTLDHLCDDNNCYGIRDGLMLYYDDDHLSKSGSRLIASKFSEYINRSE